MSGATRACPLCGGDTHLFLRNGPLVVVRCRACLLAFLADGGTADQAAAYDDVYCEGGVRNDLNAARYADILDAFEPFRRNGSLLEIGFGAGDLLRMGAARGWRVMGTEVSSVAVARLKRDGLDVRVGEHAAADVPAGSFDGALLIEVIEHVEDPRATLLDAARALRVGGRLVLSTPNIDSATRHLIGIQWRIVVGEHRWYFCPRSLRRILHDTGFVGVSVRTRNIYPPEILRSLRRGATSPVTGSTTWAPTSDLRRFTSTNAIGRVAKAGVNAVLSATGLGDTIWASAVRSAPGER